MFNPDNPKEDFKRIKLEKQKEEREILEERLAIQEEGRGTQPEHKIAREIPKMARDYLEKIKGKI